MPSSRISPVEKLRRIWTPEREIDEIFSKLDPGTELDSMIRDLLHRTIQQKGPVTLSLDPPNTGTLRWEIIHYEPHGLVGHREISIWVEDN
jgi:hypothetical protein